MKLALSPLNCRRLAAFLLLAGCLEMSVAARAAAPSVEDGAQWLQAELPAKVTLLNADCEQLAAAVGKATLVHQPEAAAILRVALTRGVGKLSRGQGKLPGACAQRIFSVSVAAAPMQASALLDLATELYPACAAELAGTLRDYDRVSYDYKDRVLDDKTVVDDKNGPARSTSVSPDPNGIRQISNDLNNDPANTIQDPSDLSARDITGLGFSDAYGFSPGFTGAPGFIGSVPDGGLALPPASVTSVVNG